MQELKDKIKYIFIPFLALNIAFIVMYSLLSWRFYADIGCIKLILMGIFISIIGIYVFLRPRINLLRFQNKNKKEALYIIVFLIMLGSLFFIKAYFDSALGKLTILDKISMINDVPQTSFYQIKSQFIDVENTKLEIDSSLYKGRLVYHCRFKTPILDDSLLKQNPIAWICNNMEKTISNEKERGKELKKFIAESQAELQGINVAKFQYLKLIDNQNYTYSFEGKNIPFEHRNQSIIRDFLSIFLLGIVIWFCLIWYLDLDYLNLKRF